MSCIAIIVMCEEALNPFLPLMFDLLREGCSISVLIPGAIVRQAKFGGGGIEELDS